MRDTEPIVDVAWLRAHLGEPGVVVVDTRPAAEYRAAHLPGARHSDQNALRLPDSRPASIDRYGESATAEVRRLGIRPGDRVVFYEAFSGTSAARGVWMLDYLGIPGGSMLDGGLSAWLEAGGELTRTQPDVAPSEIATSPRPEVLATADEIAASLSDPASDLRVIDARSDLEYGSSTIPGAIHQEWLRHLDASGGFRPLPELAALYRAHGLEPGGDGTVAAFCGSGYRSAHAYVVLKALGFGRVKNYAPSWNEWGSRGDLPKTRPVRP